MNDQIYLSWEPDPEAWHGPYTLDEIKWGLENNEIDKTIYARRGNVEECHPLGVLLDLHIIEDPTEGIDECGLEEDELPETWTPFKQYFGMPTESTLVSEDEWVSAKEEGRVLTVVHEKDDSRAEFSGYAGTSIPGNLRSLCRLVTDRPLPVGMIVKRVNSRDIFESFSEEVNSSN
jgi:hypothetical protein